jgi:hypothetical protein
MNTQIKETTAFLHNNGGKSRRQQFERQNDDGLYHCPLPFYMKDWINPAK